jgi:hypothetical protein
MPPLLLPLLLHGTRNLSRSLCCRVFDLEVQGLLLGQGHGLAVLVEHLCVSADGLSLEVCGRQDNTRKVRV